MVQVYLLCNRFQPSTLQTRSYFANENSECNSAGLSTWNSQEVGDQSSEWESTLFKLPFSPVQLHRHLLCPPLLPPPTLQFNCGFPNKLHILNPRAISRTALCPSQISEVHTRCVFLNRGWEGITYLAFRRLINQHFLIKFSPHPPPKYLAISIIMTLNQVGTQSGQKVFISQIRLQIIHAAASFFK